MTTSATPTRPSALDRLRSLLRSPGPYTSLYLPCGEIADQSPYDVFADRKTELAEHGASAEALDALDARLRLPVPEDVGGWALFAADDGSTAVDFAPEGPRTPVMIVSALPVSAPLIEWDQWRVPHVAVSYGESTAEAMRFVPGTEPELAPLPVDPTTAAATLRNWATDDRLRLIAVIDEGGDAAGLVDRLRGIVPPHTTVVPIDPAGANAESTDDPGLDAIVDATVRAVADVVARDSVRALEDFRFMQSSGDAVEGTTAVFEALASGRGRRLLVHDDPGDVARASFGADPTIVSPDFASHPNIARRADVAIWSAMSQGMDVRIVPSTGSGGPADDIAVTLRADDSLEID